MNRPHRIRRQRWQVTAASAADAFALRSALRRDSDLTLLPVLERVFAELDDGERDIHLPRLEIKVRLSAVDRLADELPEQLLAATRLALAEALDGPPETRVGPRDASAGARLRRYLVSGQIDWFDAGHDSADVAQRLADEAARWSTAPEAAWLQLLVDLPAGQRRVDVFFRFLQLLDAGGRAAWAAFAARQAAARGGRVAAVLAALQHLQAGRPADPALRLQALCLLLVAGESAGVTRWRSEWRAAVDACAAQLASLSAADRESWREVAHLSEAGPERSPPASEPPPATMPPVAVDPEKRPFLPVDRDNVPGLPLSACGLVLLHPYLPRLFAALGWVAADPPRDEPFPPACLPRAAALLHWLATGREAPYEFELGVAKLLLGLAPDDPLPVAAGLLGAAERDEGAALLAAVVEHWPALGKTSVDGLRLSFLQRAGLLYPAPDGWLLRPQCEGFDLLLDRLPWGIAIVRLPWMRRPLHVEWMPA